MSKQYVGYWLGWVLAGPCGATSVAPKPWVAAPYVLAGWGFAFARTLQRFQGGIHMEGDDELLLGLFRSLGAHDDAIRVDELVAAIRAMGHSQEASQLIVDQMAASSGLVTFDSFKTCYAKINGSKGIEEGHTDDRGGEANHCPICFDAWTSHGAHRIVSLKCGHLFGLSCIQRAIEVAPRRPPPLSASTTDAVRVRAKLRAPTYSV